ncbi:unnamed protein product [Heligmosomoides polygyrus]|uniref:IBB domain-containing protein n=1 Tax=Heligmosomoides polygyrus TaxID=6339 RepID=A0A183FPY7_HELPZ|nr:unnamed protein product [Heligmosomoides polygyrus]
MEQGKRTERRTHEVKRKNLQLESVSLRRAADDDDEDDVNMATASSRLTTTERSVSTSQPARQPQGLTWHAEAPNIA